MNIDPASLAISDCYKLLIGIIIPRPIAFVSTCSPAGAHNLAPFSFFAGVGSNPMTVLFCPANTPEGTEKDSLRNAKLPEEGGVGQFVINTVPARLAKPMALCAHSLAYQESEFDLADLTPLPSVRVRPPRVGESPISLECQTTQVIRTNPNAPSGGNIVIGRVIHIVADDEIINDRFHVDPDLLDAIGRMAGTTYCHTRSRFELPMGRG